MRVVLRAACVGVLAALLCAQRTSAEADTPPGPSAATVAATTSCWLPEEALDVDYCGDQFTYAGADQRQSRRRARVDFDLGSLPPGISVVSAQVHLFEVAGQSGGSAERASYALFRPGDDWRDWTRGGDQQVSTESLTLDVSQGWRTWALEPAEVQGWLAAGAGGVVVHQTGDEKRRQSVGFGSAAGPRHRPYLTLTYTEPLHVSPRGLDTNPGTERRPVRSIQRAVDLAVSGETILVESGTYAGFSVPSGKTGLTIRGDSQTGVVVDNPALAVGNLVTVRGADTTLSHLTVQKCRPDPAKDADLESQGSAGIRVEGAYRATITNVTVRLGREPIDDSADEHRGRGCFGIMANQAWGLDVGSSDVYDNGGGIYVRGGGAGRIHDNTVHDHTGALIRNTPGGGDDFGAAGISFDHVLAGEGGYTAEGNTLTDNAAASYDYGFDGGGFEIYASSGVVMRHNTLVANDTALETGADTDSEPDVGCSGNSFTNNTVVGYDEEHPKAEYAPDRLARKGLVLRCDQDMLVGWNTLTDVEYGAFTLTVAGGVFDATLDGLQIIGNAVTQHGQDHFVTVEADLSTFEGLAFSGNTYYADDCDWFFGKFWFLSEATLAEWQAALTTTGAVSPAETGSTSNCV